ncbi:MAG: hypothetical protein OJF47_001478 [Nitrospira sp.]|jgi:hypothetical protein|nr:MAG: hypothetical protein OJF47_001478 [Nitrospira sp.]
MPSLKSILPILLMLMVPAGCTSLQPLSCLPNERPTVTDSLYFGTAKPGGVVSQEEWAAFVNDTVMPAFPEGFTSWSATGQWQMASGRIEQEPSYVLQLTHEGSRAKETAVQHIVAKYKNDFQQEAVMRIRSQACRSF